MKHVFLVVAFLWCGKAAWAQTGLNLQWERTLNNAAGSSNMRWNALLPASGGVMVAGQVSHPAGYGMYLAHYLTNGQVQWDTTLITPGTSTWEFLVQDGDFFAVGTELVGGQGEWQVHLLRVDVAGQVVWRRTYRGPDGLFAVATDCQLAGGHLHLCGQQESPGGETSWVAQFDRDGNLVWDQTFTASVPTFLSRLTVGPTGAVTAVGSADNAYAFLAVQYSSAGVLNWQYPASLTSGLTQYLADVAADPHGNVYAIGARESGIFETDIITLKLGPAGNLKWEKALSNQDENEGRRLRFAPNGDVYSLGNLSNAALGLVIRYDTAGNSLWTRSFQLGNEALINEAVVDAAGDLYVGVRDFDSVGVFRITAAGTQAAKAAFGEETASGLGALTLAGGSVFAAANGGPGGQATLLALAPATLSETLRVSASGIALSDARPGALATDGNHLWLSTFSDDGDSAIFAITRLGTGGTPTWERSRTYATVISGYPYLIPDGAGGIVGLFQNSRNVDGGQMGLIKYDAAGQEQFLTLIGSPELLNAGGMVLDPTGHIYVVANDATNRRMRLARYDPAGAEEWVVTYQSPSTTFAVSRPFQMQRTPQGKYVIAAAHRGASEDNDLHLFQYTDQGNLEWQADVAQQAGNTTSLAGMQVLPNGDIVVFGASTITQYAAARFNSSGTRLWVDEGTNPFSAAPRSLAVDAQGRAYLCFSTNNHVYVRQLDAAGTLIGEETFDTPTSGTFFFPRQSTVVGGLLAILGDHLMSGRQVPFQMLIDDQLNLVYVQVDSATTAQFQALAVDPTGNLYGAYLTGDLNLGSGARGTLVRRYGIGTVGLDPRLGAAGADWRLYPNPAQTQVTLAWEVAVPGWYAVQLVDMQGRPLGTLSQAQLPAGPARLEVPLPASLAPGVYLASLRGPGTASYRPLVIRR